MVRWFRVILLVLVAAGGMAWFIQTASRHPQKAQQGSSAKGGASGSTMTVAVAVADVRRGDIPVYFDGLGSVGAYYTVTVRSRIDGALQNVYFQEGQSVRAGDLLAEIDPRPYQVQLEQAEGQLARDQALLANARLDVERYKILVAQDAIPSQQLDTQLAAVKQFEGIVKTDQANIDNAKLQIDYCRITAPIEGRVGLRQVDPGNMVHAGDQNGLVVITQLQPIAVYFTIPEDSLFAVLKKIRAGATLKAEAYNRDRTTRIATGTLTTVDNQIDPSTGTSRLKAVFENRDGALFPNQFVNVRLLVDVLRQQLIVPAAAIQRGAQGTYVYIVKPDNTAEFRRVTVGISEANNSVISQGLNPGERVVVDGVDKLQPGSHVAIRSEPAATQSQAQSAGNGVAGPDNRAGSAGGRSGSAGSSSGAAAPVQRRHH